MRWPPSRNSARRRIRPDPDSAAPRASVRVRIARAPLRQLLAVMLQRFAVAVVHAGIAAAVAAVARQRRFGRDRAGIVAGRVGRGQGCVRSGGRGHGRAFAPRAEAAGVRAVHIATARLAPDVNRGTLQAMPRPDPSRKAARAARRWRLRALAPLCLVAGLLPGGAAMALDPSLPVERYTITRWHTDDGLPHSQIHDIGQGRDGFLWLTTWEGTAR